MSSLEIQLYQEGLVYKYPKDMVINDGQTSVSIIQKEEDSIDNISLDSIYFDSHCISLTQYVESLTISHSDKLYTHNENCEHTKQTCIVDTDDCDITIENKNTLIILVTKTGIFSGMDKLEYTLNINDNLLQIIQIPIINKEIKEERLVQPSEPSEDFELLGEDEKDENDYIDKPLRTDESIFERDKSKKIRYIQQYFIKKYNFHYKNLINEIYRDIYGKYNDKYNDKYISDHKENINYLGCIPKFKYRTSLLKLLFCI